METIGIIGAIQNLYYIEIKQAEFGGPIALRVSLLYWRPATLVQVLVRQLCWGDAIFWLLGIVWLVLLVWFLMTWTYVAAFAALQRATTHQSFITTPLLWVWS